MIEPAFLSIMPLKPLYPVYRDITAVNLGFPVTASSIWNGNHFNYQLNFAGNGQVFKGNYDRNTQVTNCFTPVMARTLRIRPLKWHGHISMRFDAYFQEESKS